MATKIDELFDKARKNVNFSVREVYGEPYERNGVTLIPVARVIGAGGGGGGTGPEGDGAGIGYGLRSEPVGVYVINGDKVRFEPAVNVNKIVAGAFAVAIVAIAGTPRIIKQARKFALAYR